MAKRRRRRRIQNLTRIAEVRSFNVHVSAGIEDANSANPRRRGSAWLEVRGVMDEPVKGTSEIRISVHEAKDDNLGTTRPAVVGYVFGTRPDVHVVVTVEPMLFERAWSMAISGNLKNVWLSMTPPYYGNADVPSISFSNEPIE
jgi:hypothetical protein